MLVIDLFNVLHAVPKAARELGGWRGRGSVDIERLASLIAASRFAGEPVWLVCDGTGGGRARRGEEELGNVRVLYAGPGKDADSLIERILDDLERCGKLGGLGVVSSDRRVQAAAVGVRVRWMTSEAFVRLLVDDAARAERARQGRTGGRPEFATRDKLDDQATAVWMREFGFEAEDRRGSGAGEARDEKARRAEDQREPRGEVLDAKTLAELEEWAKRLERDEDG